MKRSLFAVGLAARSIGLSSALVLSMGLIVPAQANVIKITNLVTDDQSANPAQITDANLKNAWGMSYTLGGSPFWISDNATGVSTLYNVNPLTNATVKNNAITEAIPGDGSVTGQVFNSAGAGNFLGANFMFVSEDGTISVRIGAVNPALVLIPATPDNANVYKGAAYAVVTPGNAYLYAANFRTGKIDVVKGNAGAPDLTGTFTDPGLPAGYAPFNIQNLGGRLYVAYALQDGAKKDEVAGAGNGFVSVFSLNGEFIERIASDGSLDAPWGLAIAPVSFGLFAGDLLVGNFGNGTISMFDLATHTFLGLLPGDNGNPVTIDGLWGLMIGNGGNSGSASKVYFTAGPDDETHGLFGVLESVAPEPATLLLFSLGLAGLGFFSGGTFGRRPRTSRLVVLPA